MGLDELPSLWAHQAVAIEKANNASELALFLPMGTGKTRTMIEILRTKYNLGKEISNTLIICPLIVCSNWKNEFTKYSKIPAAKILLPKGTIKEKAAQIIKHEGIVVVNYDIFVNEDLIKALIKWKPAILVLDESHRCKNPQASRTKKIMKLSHSMGKEAFRYLMTGTPVLNNQLDLWSQFYILDLGETLGDSFFSYRARYFWDLNAGKRGTQKYFPMFVPKKSASEELRQKIESKSVVAKKEDCLDLPPLVKKQIEVDLASDQRAAYEEMKKEFITYVQDKACVATLAITKALRMQQILSGFVRLEDGSIHRFKENPRAKALKELLEEICIEAEQKCIVWSVFHEDYEVIRKTCEDLKIEYREIHGLVSGPDKLRAMEDFELKPEVKIIVGSPGAGGIGVNLIAASYSIWYSRNFNLEHDQQAEARNYRGGSERHKKVTRLDLVAPGTLDALVLDALSKKKKLADSILTLPQLL